MKIWKCLQECPEAVILALRVFPYECAKQGPLYILLGIQNVFTKEMCKLFIGYNARPSQIRKFHQSLIVLRSMIMGHVVRSFVMPFNILFIFRSIRAHLCTCIS